MPASHYTRIIFAERPRGDITQSTFRREVVPLDLAPGHGEVLVRVEHLSLDPAMRDWMNTGRSYIEPMQIGQIMRASGIGTVVQAGAGSGFKLGDVVNGAFGACWILPWRRQFQLRPRQDGRSTPS